MHIAKTFLLGFAFECDRGPLWRRILYVDDFSSTLYSNIASANRIWPRQMWEFITSFSLNKVVLFAIVCLFCIFHFFVLWTCLSSSRCYMQIASFLCVYLLLALGFYYCQSLIWLLANQILTLSFSNWVNVFYPIDFLILSCCCLLPPLACFSPLSLILCFTIPSCCPLGIFNFEC